MSSLNNPKIGTELQDMMVTSYFEFISTSASKESLKATNATNNNTFEVFM